MAAGVRIIVQSFPGGQPSPTYYDTTSFASVSAAISGVSSGFLSFTPADQIDEAGETSDEPSMALAVTSIQSITAVANVT